MSKREVKREREGSRLMATFERIRRVIEVFAKVLISIVLLIKAADRLSKLFLW